MRSRSRQRSSRSASKSALVIAAAAGTLPAAALQKDWKNTLSTGNWSTPGNWVQNSIPAGLDDAFIVSTDGTNRVVTYDYAGAPVTLASLRLDNTGTGTNTLSQGGNTLSAIAEYVGYSGHGAYTQ